ncbi:1-(5-phosphoribosyl)-5-[(5-phosphoribosylamino)methylideneamino]imidazole-4-carboxamide isomerase [Bacillaceae bacterium S4-13-56]
MDIGIYPAIDMRGGKCVRLLQGDYAKETIYGDSPFDMAKTFVEAGVKWIHMVDLDGARDGKRINAEHVLRVAKELPVKVQIGGGIRSEEDVAFYVEQGADRVIIGSIAVSNKELTKELLKKYPGKIAIGLDVKDGFVATHGWYDTSSVTAVELGKEYAQAGASIYIYTDISKDGMMQGPNVQAITELAEETGVPVIASGGVRGQQDVEELSTYPRKLVEGAIIGKALYTGAVNLRKLMNEVDSHAD